MSLGKRVADELYLHLSVIGTRPADEQWRIRSALAQLEHASPAPNVVKLGVRSGRLSLLAYPHFDEEPFPALAESWTFSAGMSAPPAYRSYNNLLNPPILHRKELLVTEDYPNRQRWCELTAVADSLGLFDDATAIGFRRNWERLIEQKGYRLVGDTFYPIANVEFDDPAPEEPSSFVQRHLTALSRSGLSAPVQLLLRHGLLALERSFFDYGCGRGGDIAQLQKDGFMARGWDPYFAPSEPVITADVVNLGFVVNVIDDPAERVEALSRAFSLARLVLAVGVMLYSGQPAGRRFGDGYLTSRQTFQKYFTQAELKDFVEQVLHREAFTIGPGVVLVFADAGMEQRFCADRHRSRGLASRLLTLQRASKNRIERTTREPQRVRSTAPDQRLERARPLLDQLWETTLELGRYPEQDEVADLPGLQQVAGGLPGAVRLLERHYDSALLASAAQTRADDLRLFLACRQFLKRGSYSQLEPRLRRDVKTFFGSYRAAQDAALRLLAESADHQNLFSACRRAADEGLGAMEGEQHALQLHMSTLERLPVHLRAYVSCGLLLWDSISEVDLIKIHIGSSKLTLLEFDDFDGSRLPLLRRRIKINLRELDYDVFDYGSEKYPKPVLYGKSRFLHEDYPGYAEQFAFDEALAASGALGESAHGPGMDELRFRLDARRLSIRGGRLLASDSIPDLDSPCGRHFTFRSFIECGDTQSQTGLPNTPRLAASYNALHGLATQILDPVVDYFGGIRLTYGFCSPELGRHIKGGVAPKLDQHASCETSRRGGLICARGGAACDFLVEDEDMEEVARWILANTPFDRLYFYGRDRPLHVSYSPQPAAAAYRMVPGRGARLLPRAF